MPGGNLVDGTNIPFAGRSGGNAATAATTVIALPYDGTGDPADFTAANAAYITRSASGRGGDPSQMNGAGAGPRNLYRRTRASEVAVSRAAATIERQLAAHRRGESTAGAPASLFTNPSAASGGRSARGAPQEVQAYVVS